MNTLFTGQHLIELPSVDSTNNYAMGLVREEKCTEGTVVLAHQQPQGRGQRGSAWSSKPFQNLTFSLILQPHFLPADKQFLLSMAVSLGLVDYLKTVLPDKVEIKWPNDILVNQTKICGILIETTLRQHLLSSAVIGIGLNINQIAFPKEIKATSVKLETGQQSDLKACLANLCSCLEARYLQLRAGKFTEIKKEYHASLYRQNTWANYTFKNAPLKAFMKGVDQHGRLELETENGTTIQCDIKEVGFE